MARQLRVQMLEFEHQLLVTAGLAGLALERADLAFDFADQVGHAQQILLGGFQLAQRLLFLRLEFGDARRLFKNQRRSSGLLERICVMFPWAMML
jgi:hypothetical protein